MSTLTMSKFKFNIIFVFLSLAFVGTLAENNDKEVTEDGAEIVINVQEISSDQSIKIYYDDNESKLIVTQLVTSNTSDNVLGNLFDSTDGTKLKNLEKIVPDTETITLNPKEINSENVHVYRKQKQIHVYQGKENITLDLVPKMNETVDLGMLIQVNSNEFNPNQLVSIFVVDNKLVLTQLGTPEETDRNLVPIDNLQIVTSKKNKLLLHSARFNPEIPINILAKDGKIGIWTGTNQTMPENNIDIPEIVDIIPPEIPDFDTSFDTEQTLEVYPEEFNIKKSVWIFYDKNTVFITQVGAPEETKQRKEYKYKNLRVITPDVNKLQLYPGRVSPNKIIRIRHENGQIYVWQGSKLLPKESLSRPDVFKIIEPAKKNPEENALAVPEKQPVTDGNNSTIDKEMVMFVPEINLKQLISIVMNNNSDSKTKIQILNTTHIGLSNEMKSVYNNSQSLIFFPVDINLDFQVDVDQGNKVLPEKVVEIIHKTIKSNKTLKMNKKEFNSDKLVKVFYKNKLLQVTQNGTSEETFDKTESIDYKNLQIVQPDSATLLIHLAFVDPDLVINIRHQDGNIYIWQESEHIPQENIDTPNVEVIRNLDKFCSESQALYLSSDEWNPDKLVLVTHEDNKIHAYQVDRDEDISSYTNISSSIPHGKIASFDPQEIKPEKMIFVNYSKKTNKMYITIKDE